MSNDALEQRVGAAREVPLCKAPNYARFDRGQLVEVFCKVCGVTIRKMLPGDTEPEVRRVGGQTLIRERVALYNLPNYREALVSCNDGSAHVTAICVDCAPKLKDPALREEVYANDLAQWSKEGVVSTALATRNPEALVEFKDVIQ